MSETAARLGKTKLKVVIGFRDSTTGEERSKMGVTGECRGGEWELWMAIVLRS